LNKVFQYIDEHQDLYIEWLQKACRQPSVSVHNRGMREMAKMVEDFLMLVKARVELVETKGFPVIFGEIYGHKERTLTFYNHYDVQPEEPLALWKTDPFAAVIRDGRMWGRGTADNKGNLMARICAVHAYQNACGELPVNLKFLFEGEEETGSPNLEDFSDNHPEKVKTDGIIWEGGIKGDDGRLEVGLGVKGICYVELRVRGAASDVHSSEAPIVINPAWRLIWALNTLKNENDEILVKGFYDKVKPLTPEERQLVHALDFDETGKLKSLNLKQFLQGTSGNELKERLLSKPTCTICGIQAGYTGEGAKTVLPAEAKVKIDFRLVPDQDPENILHLLCRHLAEHGYADIEVIPLTSGHPFNTDPAHPLVKTVMENAEKVYGKPPKILRNSPGSSPMYKVCRKLKIPAVQIGVANEHSQYHAPNENILIQDYIDGIKMTALVIHEFSKKQ
jgi:acetylornithine deacetylase/succinyl-diaminopimelate desuccinylase-like protein